MTAGGGRQGEAGSGNLGLILETARDLLDARSEAELYRLAVERGRLSLDVDRMGVLLYDAVTREMVGTWGTDEHGLVCDESGFRAPLPAERGFVAESLDHRDLAAFWEDRELTQAGKAVGRGWNAMIALRDGREVLGWIAADNLLRHVPLDTRMKGRLVLYGQILANIIVRLRNDVRLEAGIEARTAELRAREERLRRLYDELGEQNEAKERLFTILAHDLRGPVGNVRSLLTAVLEGELAFSDGEIRAYLPEIRKSVDSVYLLLENLLDWVRSGLKEISALRERLLLKPLLGELTTFISAAAAAKRIRVEVVADPALATYSDRRMVEAILRNFLTNALKFTPEGGRVALSARRDAGADETRISVSDSGVGIDEATLARLFSVDPSKRREGTAGERGSGIALMFCKDLARSLGGRIEVASVPGRGSDFSLVLPEAVEGELPLAH